MKKKVDYYIEYYEVIDKILWSFIKEMEALHPDIFYINGYSAHVSVVDYFFYFHSWRDIYNNYRKKGYSVQDASIYFYYKLKANFSFNGKEPINQNNGDIDNDAWKKDLKEYKNQIIFYIYEKRHWDYFKPIIFKLKKSVLIFSEYIFPDDIDLPSSVMILEMSFLRTIKFKNLYLQQKYLILFNFFNTYLQLIDFLIPSCIVVLEGCNFRHKILASLCRKKHIPCICMQQGWPSFLHSRFRNFEYSHFITWGDGFNELWKEYNPLPVFLSIGYPYEVITNRKKDCITFFLQGPFFISDQYYYDQFLLFILNCINNFPDVKFQIREHPAFRIPESQKVILLNHNNIIDVSEKKLEDVFSETEIVVSIFSSTLMEGIAHGCIPFVYDLAHNSFYNPNIEEIGFGVIAKSESEGLSKMEMIIRNIDFKMKLINKGNEMRDNYFKCVSDNAAKNIAQFIENFE